MVTTVVRKKTATNANAAASAVDPRAAIAANRQAEEEKRPSFLRELRSEDSGNDYYDLQRLQHMLEFLSHVPEGGRLAYSLCHAFEDNWVEVTKINQQFPAQKAEFIRDFMIKVEPLSVRYDALQKELEALLEDPKTNKEKIEEIKNEQENLGERLNIIQEKPYVHKYPNDGQKTKEGKVEWKVDPEDWNHLKGLFSEEINRLSAAPQSRIQKNLQVLCEELGLSESETKIMLFLEVMDDTGGYDTAVTSLIQYLRPATQGDYNAIIANMTGLKEEEVSAMFNPESHLMQYGLIAPYQSVQAYSGGTIVREAPGFPTISTYLGKMLYQPNVTADKIKDQLIGHTLTTDLDWEKDFHHRGEDGRALEERVKENLKLRAEGKPISDLLNNFVFDGPPNTGKTTSVAAFVKFLQENVDPDIELRVIGQHTKTYFDEEEIGGSIPYEKNLDPIDRISQIKMALALGAKNPKTLFLIEEPDAFMPVKGATGWKEGSIDRTTIQDLLAKHGATALFITTNHFHTFQEAARRRHGHYVYCGVPNVKERKDILANACERFGVTLSQQEIDHIAETYVMVAGQLASAVERASIAKAEDRYDRIIYWLENQAMRDTGSVLAVQSMHLEPKHGYDVQLINPFKPSYSLDTLEENLKDTNPAKRKMRILIEGHDGTDKTQLVQHLADVMGDRPVVHISPSEFAEGGLERAFKEAKDLNAVLHVDDQFDDAFRKNSNILQALERYEGTVVVTTSDFAVIPENARKIFNYQLGLDYLTQDQNLYAFKKILGHELPKDTTFPTNLTPSDYDLVRIQAEDVKKIDDIGFLRDLLATISKDKRDGKYPTDIGDGLGFRAGLARDAGRRPYAPSREAA